MQCPVASGLSKKHEHETKSEWSIPGRMAVLIEECACGAVRIGQYDAAGEPTWTWWVGGFEGNSLARAVKSL